MSNVQRIIDLPFLFQKPAVFDKPGEHVYARPLKEPENASAGDVIHFYLDKALTAGNPYARELGIIVASVDVPSVTESQADWNGLLFRERHHRTA
jgi:hypothetical protein